MEIISPELECYYDKKMATSISELLKEKLKAIADEIVKEYMSKTDIKSVFISKAKKEFEDDILVIRVKTNYNK